jgi:aspartate dehydrogenase
VERKRKMKRVGVIGCGAIGGIIAEAFERRILSCDELVLYDYELERAETLKSQLHVPVRVVLSLDEMLKFKPKVIVEAASQQAAREYVPQIVAKSIDVIVMSTGALLGLNVRSRHVHVPSGAIGGLDALSAVALAGVDEVVLTTRKNPKSLDVNYVVETVIYEGDAEEAARRFPREMNVAATLALTVKPTRVRVRVVADPLVHRNTHEISVKWRFGEIFLRFANDPHPENPRTSALAAWSAIKLLQTLLEK